MQLIHRFRLHALFCSLAVLICELIARPYANMSICDDGPYILMAHTLAATGHIVYNGWAAAMLGWQLYLGAALVKLFGFSFTTVRMSTLLVAMALAFVLQRALVRANISERNATIGTLALVLSPLYLMLSATFMSDIHGLFAIVLCFYGCLRALQSTTSRAAIAWICFAVIADALCGTSRQIAWLGILVMVPSALWLLRAQRRILIAGAVVNLAGALLVFGCVEWLKRQPYIITVPLFVHPIPVHHVISEFVHTFLDIPFLLLPIVALFLPQVRKSRTLVVAIVSILFLVYLALAFHTRRSPHFFLLEPTKGDWVALSAMFNGVVLRGTPLTLIHSDVRVLLTILSFGGTFGLIASLIHTRHAPAPAELSTGVSWQQLFVLLVPFTLAYSLLLIPSASILFLFDRYTLPLLVVATLCLVRYYQDRIGARLPLAATLLVGIMAIWGIAATHNTFAFDRARVVLAAELSADGVPPTSVDNGWEYNIGVELQHAPYVNDSRIVIPAHTYIPVPPPPAGPCKMFWYYDTPHIHPLYGVSFEPNACYGPAPFAPVHYSRWFSRTPGTLYVVRYTPPAKP